MLNQRRGVRASTVDEVHRAIADLERQRTQFRLSGRTFVINLVMQTPDRYSTAVRAALECPPGQPGCRFEWIRDVLPEETLAPTARSMETALAVIRATVSG